LFFNFVEIYSRVYVIVPAMEPKYKINLSFSFQVIGNDKQNGVIIVMLVCTVKNAIIYVPAFPCCVGKRRIIRRKPENLNMLAFLGESHLAENNGEASNY
jgi:hypothetical protein